MKKNMLRLLIIPIIIVFFMVGGCKLDNPSNVRYTEFVIQIDSIIHPDTIKVGSALPIKFYGTIGTDGCFSFSRFEGNMDNRVIDITAYGKKSDETVCTSQMQYLDGVTLNVNQLDTGRYVIRVHRPLPPDITDTIYVSNLTLVK